MGLTFESGMTHRPNTSNQILVNFYRFLMYLKENTRFIFIINDTKSLQFKELHRLKLDSVGMVVLSNII